MVRGVGISLNKENKGSRKGDGASIEKGRDSFCSDYSGKGQERGGRVTNFNRGMMEENKQLPSSLLEQSRDEGRHC